MNRPAERAALVADDNPAARAQIAGLLEELGYAVTPVADGDAALAALQALTFDLAVLDFRMPGRDGAAVLRDAPAGRPPVIGVSAAGASRSEWGDAPLAAWLVKPVTSDLLAEAAELALTGGTAREPAVDLRHLAVYTEGDRTLERELAELFRLSAGRYIGALEAAADDRAWREAAHGLKGTARGIGATEIARLAAFAESLAVSGHGARRAEVLADLRRAADRVNAFFERHLAG